MYYALVSATYSSLSLATLSGAWECKTSSVGMRKVRTLKMKYCKNYCKMINYCKKFICCSDRNTINFRIKKHSHTYGQPNT